MGQLRTGNKRQKRAILAASQRTARLAQSASTPPVSPDENVN